MNAHTLLSDFRSRGIALIPNGEKLTVEPASRLTDADRAAIRAAKAELLAVLTAPAVSDSEEDAIDRVARFDGWLPPFEIPQAIVREIQCIEPEALRLGWSKARLWNFIFWPRTKSEPRGLASVMNDDDAIVAVSKDYIAIGSRGRSFGDYRRFWRLDG
jgi:hypothetical protein